MNELNYHTIKPIRYSESWKDFTYQGQHPESLYKISNCGRVAKYNRSREEWQLRKTYNQRKDGSGFEIFKFDCITSDHKKKRVSKAMHRIVAKLFCSKRVKSAEYVIHKDYNLSNNYYRNLKWVTQKAMLKHQQLNHKVIEANKNKVYHTSNAKLTPQMVEELKKDLILKNKPDYKIAFEYGISSSQLTRIKNGEQWSPKNENG